MIDYSHVLNNENLLIFCRILSQTQLLETKC